MTLSSNEVVSTRVGIDPRNQAQRQFVIDFNVPKLAAENDPPTASATCSTNGAISEVQVFRNATEKTWRVFLNMQPKPGQNAPVELRCALKKGNDQVSETWSYYWSPP